ncbi:hypothetical protein FRB95_002537, partial [Tulasnella sp. JGI-2019a]
MKRQGVDAVNTESWSSPGQPAAKKIKLEDTTTTRNGSAQVVEEGASDKAERKRVKKALKSNAKALAAALPSFAFDGNELKSRRSPIGIADLRDRILAILLGTPSARWLNVKNPQSIKHFVVLNVLGIDREHIDLPDTPLDQHSAYPITIPNTSKSLPSLHNLFSHACPSRAPGDQYKLHSVIHEFLQAPLLPEERAKQRKERIKKQKNTALPNDPSPFLLSPSDMISHNYRLPSYVEAPKVADDPQDTANGWTRTSPTGLSEGWVETPQIPIVDLSGKAAKQKIWAMDCEMIETTAGRELGRISIVDFGTSVVLFDQLVKPSNPVTSYLTAYSGLSEEILSQATLTLADVQAHLTAPGMIDSWTILVGHSLENDL